MSSHEEEVDLRAEKSDGKTIPATCMLPGVRSPPCASTLPETFCCPPTKLTYSCLSNFETSIYLLKQKEFWRLHQNSEDFILMIFLGFDFVKKKNSEGWSQLSWEAEGVRSRIRTLSTGSHLQLPKCKTVTSYLTFLVQFIQFKIAHTHTHKHTHTDIIFLSCSIFPVVLFNSNILNNLLIHFVNCPSY